MFPRRSSEKNFQYTMRIHKIGDERVDWDALQIWLENSFGGVYLYHPEDAFEFQESHHWVGEFDIGSPNPEESETIQEMQKAIWQSSRGYLYPVDIHSVSFCPGTSLVARYNGKVVGFAFGFFRYGAPTKVRTPIIKNELCIESQLLGVMPDFRNKGLGYLLKSVQRDIALTQGISFIHWTVDPLQVSNSILNFEKLGAISFEFFPNYYAFRNSLNQVPASRLGISWFLDSEYVNNRMHGTETASDHFLLKDIHIVVSRAELRHANIRSSNQIMAIQIPKEWNDIQHKNLEDALRIRKQTDDILISLIEKKDYVITGISFINESWYLLARKFNGFF